MATNSYISEQSPAGDFDSETISSTAAGLTATKVQVARTGGFKKNCVLAFISIETNPVRLRWDGTAPTASIGHLMNAGDTITIEGEQNVANLKLIATGSNGTAMVTFYYNS